MARIGNEAKLILKLVKLQIENKVAGIWEADKTPDVEGYINGLKDAMKIIKHEVEAIEAK